MSRPVPTDGAARRPPTWVGIAGAVAALVATVFYLYGALLCRQGFNCHEIFYSYMRADQVAKELASWHMPQVFPDACYGAGFAFPRFYPPFSLWLSGGLALALGDRCLAVNVAFFLSALASAISMFAGVRLVVRDTRLALAASLVYVSLPYRFVDVFARGALAESWTFVWYPLIAAGLWRGAARRTMPWYLPVAVAGLALTHGITGVYVLALSGLFVVLACAVGGPRAAAGPALGLALGLGLAAWFLIPQQLSMRSVWVGHPDYIGADVEQVSVHRVKPLQFFYSFSVWWWGESHEPRFADGMSFELGAAQLAFVPAALLYVRSRRFRRAPRRARLRILAWGLFATWIGLLAFMTWPEPFLRALPGQFCYVQFPWRLLGLTAFVSSLGMAVFARAGRASSRVRWAIVGVGLASVLLVPAFEHTLWTMSDWTSERLASPEWLADYGDLGYTVSAEYLPVDLDVRAYRDGRLDVGRFTEPSVVEGDGSVLSFERRELDVDAAVDPGTGSVLALPLVAYDFYRATDDRGRPLETFSREGFLAVRVAPDVRAVSVRRGVTRATVAGLVVSGTSVALAVLAAFLSRDRRPRRSARYLSRVGALG